MTKRVASLVLAIAMLLQILVPQTLIAKEDAKAPSDDQVSIVKINGYSYDAKLMLELNRLTAKNRKRRSADPGTSLFGYFGEGNEPKDTDKPKYHGEVKAVLTVKGLDGNDFQWSEIFGSEEVHLRFTQINDEAGVETGVERVLNITQAGTYAWTDGAGAPAELPLFDNNLKPLAYEVKLDEEVSDKVKLLTARLTTTGNAGTPTFEKPDNEGRIKYHLTLEIGLQQVASSKFVSKWHTEIEEAQRPQLEGTMTGSMVNGKSKTIDFKLPTNDNDNVIVRTASRRDKNKFLPEFLFKTPTVEVKTDTQGLTFEEVDGVKTVKDANHKYKYDFTYDVLNGGKLTMTEILPVTFDANGGKFDSITNPAEEQKIVKEVEYGKDLEEKVEIPRRDSHGFKGWGIKDAQDKLVAVTSEAFKNIKKPTTFYAIWKKNKVSANELVVKESYKDGTTYVNDFIPTLDDIKAQVKIKDGDGNLQPLVRTDKFEILDDNKQPIAATDLKDKLYEKLKEEDTTETFREVQINVRVTRNNVKYPVTVKIKVYKNIYEAKTEEGRPVYVPTDYVKVTVDPTTKAEKPQKYFYYVNPEAKVVIPGENPTGTGENKFTKWLIKGTTEEYKLADKPRHMFTTATTIEAQYVSDVIPANPDGSKPDTVPQNFVSVTFDPTDNGTLEGAKVFWVNPDKEVTIPVKDAAGKDGFTFKEWKIGVNADGAIYTPSTPKKFEGATTIIASYDQAGTVIPYDPNSPITKPDGYIRVKYVAEHGLTLSNIKYYYVKKNATDPTGKKMTLGDLKKPSYAADMGYSFKEWTPADNTEIGETDITVIAKAKETDGVIEKKPGVRKPDGYVEVKFVAGANGKLTEKGSVIAEKVFFVNPKKYVTITTPATEGDAGYVFGAWDKDARIPTVYTDKLTTITANFNEVGDVKEDPEPKGPNDVTITFKLDGEEGGKIVLGSTAYYVTKGKEVSINPPQINVTTGYKFLGWTPDTTVKQSYDADKTVTGTFEKLQDIIDGDQAKPDGYVTVTFVKGINGKSITGQTVYYVNPNAGKTIADLTKPTVKADTGYIQKGPTSKPVWKPVDTTEITKDITVEPEYEVLRDVVPKMENGSENAKPDGYIEVTFSTETNGKVKDTNNTTTKVLYLNPDKALALEKFAPKVDPKTGYDFADWDTQIDKLIQYKDGNIIKAKYNEKGDVISQVNDDGSINDKPAGYVTVTFAQGEHGELSGKTVYYVNPNKEVIVPAPKVTEEIGWKQKTKTDAWNQALTQKFEQDATITAQYDPIADIVAKKNCDESDKPKGYVRVEFDKGDHGKEITGQTVYYVNPNKTVKLTAPTVTAETGWKQKDAPDAWDTALNQKFEQDATIKAEYEERKDVIEKTRDDDLEKPDGYITVKLIPTDKAKDATPKTYFVNPNNEVTITNKPEGKTEKVGEVDYTYTFRGWTVTSGVIASWSDEKITGKFTQETEITAIYSKEAKTKEPPQYDPNDVIPFDPSDLDDPSKTFIRPSKDYIKITFEAEPGLKLTESKAYYVRKNAKVKGDLTKALTLKAFDKPEYKEASGYKFDKWEPADTTEIKDKDITVTAKARKTYSECTPDYRPDDRPDYETRYKYRDRIVEKEKIVEKIVKVGSDDMFKEIRYMQGFEGKFRPYDGLRRCEAAQILANALKADGYRYNEHYALSYTDVGNEWYTDAIRVVTQAGVFAGYNDGTFKPNGKITRAEWISTLRRFQNLRVEAGNLMNLKPGHWASGEVGAALMAGWLEIYVNGTVKFDADAPITRQEVAAVSNKAFRRVLDKVYLRRSVNILLSYKDINPSMPLYEDILCASNTLLTDGRYYKANTIVMDNVTFNIVTDLMKITQKKFQYNGLR